MNEHGPDQGQGHGPGERQHINPATVTTKDAKPESKRADAESGKPAGAGYDHIIARWTVVLGVSTIVLSIATIVSAYFLFETDQTIKKQVEATRVQLRAYVGVPRVNGITINKKEEGKPDTLIGTDVAVTWKNFGSTPAEGVETWISSKWLSNGLEPDFAVPAAIISDKSGVSLGPGVEGSMDLLIPLEDLQKASAGNGRVFMWGHAQYRDSFPDTPIRHSHFCLLIQGKPPEALAFRAYKPECNYSK
jgi:hypothetical protein